MMDKPTTSGEEKPDAWMYELRFMDGTVWSEWRTMTGTRVPLLGDDTAQIRNERPLFLHPPKAAKAKS